ncbi:hypothetical protein V1L54_20420 [Streptomyces sp. TRM 70361]|uniref:hypothetical protein n=1 Tax=Streptomyces sp. TRM 70361 TaxID=3116553 RepID=UPI002E7BF4E0|nr:hypothetical protein [Streptomyces sp. TRM 70361]MEE1941737.1 hypothetical protein [Streptomyces sp. TRM 70361]
MQSPHPRRRTAARCLATTLTSALTTALAAALTAALAVNPAPAAADTGDATPGTGRELVLSPHHGGAGTTVGVRAVCEAGGPGGTVSSPAFERTVALERPAGGPVRERHATAAVRPGLAVGGSYPVIVLCGTGELLSGSFVHTGVVHTGATGSEPLSPRAAAVGGAALAGVAGLLVALRRRTAGQPRRPLALPPVRRRHRRPAPRLSCIPVRRSTTRIASSVAGSSTRSSRTE